MGNDIEKRNNNLPATDDYNPFSAFGNATTSHGTLLKFNKGTYVAGRENTVVPLGTQLVVFMADLLIGWVYWEDHQPIEEIMGLMSQSYQPPRLNELPNVGNGNGEWQFTIHAPVQRIDNGAKYTFTTSTDSGVKELKKLCRDYGEAMRQHPDEDPVVALDASSYLHPKREYGRVHTPVLTIVGWTPKGDGNGSGGDAPNEPPKSSPPSSTAAKPPKAKSTVDTDQQF